MKNILKAFTTLLLLISLNSFSQGESWRWYFGYNAGLNFPGGGAPVALTNGMVNTSEGSASIADAAGNLLFYTDGITVYAKTHTVMANGNGLMGNPSSTQSGVIIQKPGSTNLYYIFTTDAQLGPGGLRWTEVDMNLNGGFGGVTANKNILLQNPSCEKVTGVRHCNNKDIWIITHDWNNNQFRTFLVTAAGVGAPVLSSAGLVASGSSGVTIGQLKGSPDGKKLGSCIWDGSVNRFELFDFNNATGIVSNAILLPQQAASSGAYGCEFSPDGTRFYGTEITPGKIYQWDLCAGTNAAIAASVVFIGQSANNFNGSLQLGPDKRIYVARLGVPWVGVIPNPNTLGAGCGYIDNAVSLSGKNGSLGLPNFVPFYFKQPPPPITNTIVCLNVNFTSPTVNITNCNGSTNAITSFSWNFGDPSSGASNISTVANPLHAFSGTGTYNVVLLLNYACGADTLKKTVSVISCSPQVIVNSPTVCSGICAVLTATPSGGTGPYTFTWTPNIGTTAGPFTVCPTSTTVYSVIIKDATGAIASNSTTAIVNPSITLTPTVTNIPCFGQANGTGTAALTGGTGPFNYTWTNGQNTPVATSLTPGPYSITVIDSKGCTATGTVTITQPPVLTATITSQNILCNGVNIGTVGVVSAGGTGVHTYLWNNNVNSPSQSNLGAGNYSVMIKDANNCTFTLSTNITQPPALSLTINSSTTNVCAGTTINLNSFASGGTGPYTYTWNPGPNSSAYNVSEIIAGNYNYILNVTDNNGCPITKNINLTFNPIPSITASSQTICYGDKGVLTANGAETYKWLPVNSTGSTFTVTGANSLYLTVVGTNTSTGCSSLPVTSTLIVNSLPVPAISASGNKGCVPLCMTFTASNNGGSIQSVSWEFGDGAFASNVINTDRCYTIAGDYTVRATVTDLNGCVSSTTYSVETYPIPVADFNYSPLRPIENDEVTFTDATHEATIAKWDWYFMNLPKPHSNYQNPTYIYSEAGTYPIALVVTSNHGCTDTIVKVIFVGEDYGLYVPNVFSPNGDGLNDVFQPKGFGITKYELRIFNRWGEELMFTNDFAHGWDGMWKGKLSKEDTYIWKINLTNVFGKSHELTGNVTLIK